MMDQQGIVAADPAAVPVADSPVRAVAFYVDPAIFSVNALLRAAYKFTDLYHIFVHKETHAPERWLVVIRSKSDSVVSDQVSGDFANELIDQQLRERLEQQFGDVRTLIVAQAFSEGNLLDPTGDGSDYIEDHHHARDHR